MKNRLSLFAAALAFFAALAPLALEAGGYPAQFRGVCQQCGRDLIAYYRPVLCIDGRTEYQWVNVRHRHCRPACKGRVKYDFFNSYLMNPANPKWKDVRSGRRSSDCCH